MEVGDGFGANVFTDAELARRVAPDVYEAYQRVRRREAEVTPALADEVAAAALRWALERGATHYCHWFHPLTGATAEKHESFLAYGAGMRLLQRLSGAALVRGEADASSLPHGSMRATFEARGYTIWDVSSQIFLREEGDARVLCVPTAYCSYRGESLDEKAPLLRAVAALEREARRALAALGRPARRVEVLVGPEQEYFLVDAAHYEAREDLRQCGRTLFGAPPARSEQLRDQYYAAIRPRVLRYMAALNAELRRLGVPAKTQHNEVAPAQHELAVLHAPAQLALDQNQLAMECMRRLARRHGLVCLLHEKPFAGLSGSGKHDNWSVSADGANLLAPAPDAPAWRRDAFALLVAAVVAAADRHAALLRASVASAGNELRLGAAEAPGRTLSVCLGAELRRALEDYAAGAPDAQDGGERPEESSSELRSGTPWLPSVPRDGADRNRTAALAFTGDKFEFRMPGAAQSVGLPTTVLCAAVAEALAEAADALEGAARPREACRALVGRLLRAHGRVLYDGDCYGAEWECEARKRGLPAAATCAEAYGALTAEASVALFARTGVLTRAELELRRRVLLEAHAHTVLIEGACLAQIVRRRLAPAAAGQLAALAEALRAAEAAGLANPELRALAEAYNGRLRALLRGAEALRAALAAAPAGDEEARSEHAAARVAPAMEALRADVDWLEGATDAGRWGLPSYADILFYE